MSQPERPPRRRRRAVGPAGAAPAGPAEGLGALGRVLEPAPLDERPPADDDERLRRDVPPHHGG